MIASSYDPTLVVMSVVIASLASYTALDLAGRVTAARGRRRIAWLASGSAAMGLGIWSMHFVGMLAFRMPMTIAYDVRLVALSALTAIAASGLALFVVSQAHLPTHRLVIAGVIMGLAIVAMHYIGMASMRVPAILTYDVARCALSIAIAIIVSLVALWIAFRFRHHGETSTRRWPHIGGAVAMGSAIAGLHYTGMSAAHFTPSLGAPAVYPHTIADGTPLAIAVIAGTLLVLALALIGATMDRRGRVAKLHAALAAAEQANRLKSEFLANMSHELRTPLHTIMGFAQLMHQGSVGPISPEHHEYLGDILFSSRHLLQLINDVLDLSKVEAGMMAFHPEPIDLRRIVADVTDALRPMLRDKRMCLAVEIDPTVAHVTLDPARLKQVLYNYLSNALKFTPEDGRVTIRAIPEGSDRFCLEVEDTGIGITPTDIGRLFVAFQQLDAGAAKQYPGTGLGLALTKRLVEAQGGRVGVRSAVAAGTVFSAVLPHGR